MFAPHGVLSAGAPISSQRLFHYATSQEKSETNTTKLDERWNCSVRLSWNPAVDSLTGVAPIVQLIWVVLCPLTAQSTDVPYITGRAFYCFSEWRRIMTCSRRESGEEEVFWFKIWNSNDVMRLVMIKRFFLNFLSGFPYVFSFFRHLHSDLGENWEGDYCSPGIIFFPPYLPMGVLPKGS